jgi:hypothetical protein
METHPFSLTIFFIIMKDACVDAHTDFCKINV